jgi:hypothetical protein
LNDTLIEQAPRSSVNARVANGAPLERTEGPDVMVDWVFINHGTGPVNIGIYAAGLLVQFENHVQPYGPDSVTHIDPSFLKQYGWTDATLQGLPHDADGKIEGPGTSMATFNLSDTVHSAYIVADTPETQLSKGWANTEQVFEDMAIALGGIVLVGGIVLAATGAAVSAGVGLGAVGFLLTGMGIYEAVAHANVYPLKIAAWNGAIPYTFTIRGGPKVEINSQNVPQVTGYDPLEVDWVDNTQRSGTITSST